jgi:formamidopyrimidine-DNA glycosylase
MPELPEVETIRLGLQKYLVGRKIVDVQIRIPKIFVGDKKDVIGAKIVDIKRIGKGLIIELDNDFVLAVHLKMTGQLIYSDNNTKNLSYSPKVGGDRLPSKYTHVIFKLKSQKSKVKTATQNSKLGNGSEDAYLYYNDLRQFGWIKVVKKDEVMQMPFFKEMGPEPLKDLTLKIFTEIISKSNLAIKVLLMDQKKIGGIGNIYANDALFKAKIDPQRKAKTLSEKEIKVLHEAIYFVLKKSLEYGGSSDENFVNALGQEGNYQKHALVYGKEGEKCGICSGIIQKIKLGGRGTYFCPNCQN